MIFDQVTGILTPNIIKEMKNDLYYLIRKYCKSYQISDFRYELYLHDSTRIEYIKLKIIEIERLISIVYKYWSLFPYLISNLSYDEERNSLELKDRVLGPIDFGKTIRTRSNQQSNFVVVCTVNNKNMFIPENVLLASVVLGINLLASKFLKAGDENQIEEFKPEHRSNLDKIIDYMQFLLRDRFLKRLVDYYLLNYDNNEKIILKVNQRIIQGRLPNRYFNLIKFVRDWKNLNWILNERISFLKDALIPILDHINNDKLYEMWIFYKIISIFEPVYQKKYYNIFVSEETKHSIEYHRDKTIGWQLQKSDGNSCLVKRYPDVVISKNGVDHCVIDAKCMRYSLIDDEKQEPGPDRNIVNQMLIYLDYGQKCDLGIVLFADDKEREDIVLVQGENRKILFLNCYPYHHSSLFTLEKVRKELLGN